MEDEEIIGGDTPFQIMLNNIVKDKGGSPETYLDLLYQIGGHESAGTFDPKLRQYGGGPGRGIYQFEGINGSNRILTSAVRSKNYMKQIGMEVPEYIENIIGSGTGDASKLTKEQQDMLVLGDLRMKGGLNLSDYASGKLKSQDLWADHWWQGSKEKRTKHIDSFNTSLNNIYKTKQPSITSQPPKPVPIDPSLKGIPQYNVAFSNDNYKKLNKSNIYSEGGMLNSFNTGGTHEQNPHGGIPQGMGNNGKLNTVEEGETSFTIKKGTDYIFSDRIKTDGSGYNPGSTGLANGGLNSNCGGEGEPPCPPVKVKSKKDPRYIAYQDSLSLYNENKYDSDKYLTHPQYYNTQDEGISTYYEGDEILPIAMSRSDASPVYKKPTKPVPRRPKEKALNFNSKGVKSYTPDVIEDTPKFKTQIEKIPYNISTEREYRSPDGKQYGMHKGKLKEIQTREEYRKKNLRPNGNEYANGGNMNGCGGPGEPPCPQTKDFSTSWMSDPKTKNRLINNQGNTEDEATQLISKGLKDLSTVQTYNVNDMPSNEDIIKTSNNDDSYINNSKSLNVLKKIMKRPTVTGAYNSDLHTILMKDLNDTGTLAHEKVHSMKEFQDNQEKFIKKNFPVKDWNEYYDFLKDEDPDSYNAIKKHKKYLDRDGLYPRVMEIRQQLDLKPGQELKASDLQKIKYTPYYQDLLDYYDHKTILKILNTIASTDKKNNKLKTTQTRIS